METFGGHNRPVVGALWGLWNDGRIIANTIDYASASRRIAKPAHVDRDVKQVLFVDPDPVVRWRVQELLEPIAAVEACSDFEDARSRLLANPPDLLVTNVRLETHNGLHLVHLLRSAGAHTRCLVFGNEDDMPLKREVEAIHAWFVQDYRLPELLPAFVTAL